MDLLQKNGCGATLAPQLLLFREVETMKNKKMMILSLVLVILIAVMAGISVVAKQAPEEGAKHIRIVIVHKDGTEKNLEIATDAQYLADVLLEQELVTGYASEEYGYTIESVDGETADWSVDGAYWALYEGDEYATASAAGIVLQDGGVYKLIYETF